MSSNLIQDVQKRCPIIEDLRLRIPRAFDNAEQVKICQALKNIPRLQSLYLELDCSQRAVNHYTTSTLKEPILAMPTFGSYGDEHDQLRWEVCRKAGARPGQPPPESELTGDSLINLRLDGTLPHKICKIIAVDHRTWKCLRMSDNTMRVQEIKGT